MNFKKTLFSLFIIPLLLSACSDSDNNSFSDIPEKNLNIVTTFPPLYSFIKNIVGNEAQVANLVPAGVSVHTWEPVASDLRALSQADILIMNGLDLETFVDDMVEAVDNPDLKIVIASDGIESLLLSPEVLELAPGVHQDGSLDHSEEEGKDLDHGHEEAHDYEESEHPEHEEEHGHSHEEEEHDEESHDTDDHEESEHPEHEEGHGHSHDHNGLDPHIWLNPALAMEQVKNIRDALIEMAPQHADEFNQNASRYLEELTALDSQIREQLNSQEVTPQNFIVFHDAYTYYLNAYNLLNFRKAAVEPFPGREPTAAYLQNLLHLIEEEGVTVIFTEPQFNPAFVRSITEETGIQSFELDPIGMELSAKGYENNLRALTETMIQAFQSN